MASVHIPSLEGGDSMTDSMDFYLFSTDSEAPMIPSTPPTSVSDAIDKLNSQLSYQRRRRQKVEVDKTLLELLRLHTENHSELVLDTLLRAIDGFYSYTSSTVKDFEKCVWEAFLHLWQRQPDSPVTLSLVRLYSRFLMLARKDLLEISTERLTAVAEFLAPRCEKLLAEMLSALVAKLDGTTQINAHAAVILENCATLLKRPTATRRDCCSAYCQILKSHSAIFPAQRKVTEKLLKLAVFELIKKRNLIDLYQCTEAFQERVVERNYESAEAIGIWFANSLSLDVHQWMIWRRPFRLRQFYNSK